MKQLLLESQEQDSSPSYLHCGGLELAHDEQQLSLISDDDSEVWSSEKVCEALGAAPGSFAGGVYHASACAIYPSRATRTLARKAIAGGANFQTRTAATRIDDGGEKGGMASVETARGIVVAERGVLVCANWCTPTLLPELEPVMSKVVRDHVVVTEPIKERVWKHSFCAPEQAGSDAGDDFWYGLQLPDGRVCLGGGRLTKDGGSAHGQTDDSVCDASAVEGVTGFMAKNFPALRDAKIEHAWSGIIGYAIDEQPIVGRVPGRRRVWVCAGFGGHGMPSCLTAGSAAADLVAQGRDSCVEEGYLSTLSPARFGLADEIGAGGGTTEGVARDEGGNKAAVRGEKAGQACMSLRGKKDDRIPALGVDDGRGSSTLPQIGSGMGSDMADGNAEGGPKACGSGRRRRDRSAEEEEELEDEIDQLFADLGVKRGESLLSALTPHLEAPLPTMEPAAGTDLITEPIRMPAPRQ